MTDLDPSELGGIVSRWHDSPAARAWVGPAGFECAILPGHVGYCGYVRMPLEWRERRLHVDDIDVDVEAHGGLNWGMDDGGWIGFDTGHLGDVWLDPDAPETEGERRMRERGAPWTEPMDLLSQGGFRVWTLERLRDETEQLAGQLAAWCAAHPDFESVETFEERRDRARREMRRVMEIGGDQHAHGWHERYGEAVRRVMAPTVDEVEEDLRNGLYASDREYRLKREEAMREHDQGQAE